jgi:Rieske Fe-S protein
MNRSNSATLHGVLDRREFLHACAVLAGVTLVGTVSPLLGGCEPTSLPTPAPHPGSGGAAGNDGTVAFDVSLLDADGKSVATDINGSDNFPILIVRVATARYLALSMRCTHERCEVDGNVPQNGPILCRCHGSQFNLDGSVRKGPAAAPLTSYPTTFDEATKILRITIS